MNIGKAAERSGLNTKTIRYYESIGLIDSQRQANGYRDYKREDLERLCFLQRARAVGFTLEECRELLELYQNPERRSSEVKELVLARVEQLEVQLKNLEEMRETLLSMASHCAGNEGAECAIIDSLAKPESTSERPSESSSQSPKPGMLFTLT